MRLSQVIENDRIKAMFDKRYSGMRDSLSKADVSYLISLIKSVKSKKRLKAIPDESRDKLQALKLIDDNGRPRLAAAEPFLKWLIDNPSSEMKFKDKRADADDSLRRGHLKRDNEWTHPYQKRARKMMRSLEPDQVRAIEIAYKRFISKRTRNLAKSWGDTKATDLIKLQKLGILDDDGNVTEYGEFAINYYMTMSRDKDGMDRKPNADRIGNYGDAQKRRTRRLDRVLNK